MTTTTVTAVERYSPDFIRAHLGASQVPAALGVSPYQRPVELWEEYLGIRERGEGSAATELGQELEHGVARIAARRIGLRAASSPTLIHPGIPWLCATPDRVLDDGTLMQVKTTGLAGYAPRDRWGDEGTDQVPVHVVAQVQTEMAVARAHGISAELCHVAALIPGRGVVLYRVPYEQDTADAVISRAAIFWSLVETCTAPPPDGSDAYTDHLSRRYSAPLKEEWTEGPEVDDLVARLQATTAEYATAEAALAEAKQHVMLAIGDKAGARGTWGVQAWSHRAGRKTLHLETLRTTLATHLPPDTVTAVLAASQKEGAAYRVFEQIRKVKT